MILPTSSTGKSYPDIKGYRIVHQIGGGGFSRVFRAINPKATQHKVAAIKVVSYAAPSSAASRQLHPPDRQALRKEVQIHQVLKHQHVLEFLEAEELLKETSGNFVPGLYMVLEYGAGGDLFDKIAPDVGVVEDMAHVYFIQLMGALEYIHSQGVAHRDIKPENLLLDANGLLKLADFGLCSVYRYKGKERELKGACGSLPYIAPEMNGQPYRGEPADVWSTGVVLFALLVGNTPWDEPTRRSEEFMAYFQGKTYYPWTKIGPDALSLLHGMLNVYAQKRLTIADVKKHKWYLRDNPLMPRGEDPDPTSLAEGLLQGLIVSGDLTYQLHTDGKRAEVPNSISLTQPESFGPGLAAFQTNRLPPASAMPAMKTSDPLKVAMSQQISARRSNVPSASMDGLGMAAGAASSQFTQAMNHMTQWSNLAGGIVRFSPHLTRVFCSAIAANVASQIIAALGAMSITYTIRKAATSQRYEEDDDEDSDTDTAPYGHDDMDMDVDAQDDATVTRRRGTRPPATQTDLSNGATIRVTTTDQRKCALRGEIRVSSMTPMNVEQLQYDSEQQHQRVTAQQAQTYVLMRRSKGDPLEWRRLFRAIVTSDGVRPSIVA